MGSILVGGCTSLGLIDNDNRTESKRFSTFFLRVRLSLLFVHKEWLFNFVLFASGVLLPSPSPPPPRLGQILV